MQKPKTPARLPNRADDYAIGILVAILLVGVATVAWTLGVDAGASAAIAECNAGVIVDQEVTG